MHGVEATATVAHADDPRSAFTWDLTHERALFATVARGLKAGTTPETAPVIEVDHAYRLALGAPAGVHFAAQPGNSTAADGTFAGLVRISVANGGTCQIALDQGSWLDVVADGTALRALDYQGRSGCSSPHQIVEFAFPAGKSLLLQLSGAGAPTVTLTVTRSPTPPN